MYKVCLVVQHKLQFTNIIFINEVYTGTETSDLTGKTAVFDKFWFPPFGWTGPDTALYRSFDSSDGLVLMEGTQQMGPIPLVPGKVN